MSRKPKVEIDTAAQAAAIDAQTAAVREQTAAQQAQYDSFNKAEQARAIAAENAATLTKNIGSDLKNENVARVQAGGSSIPEQIVGTLKKRRAGGALSSQLGVNV